MEGRRSPLDTDIAARRFGHAPTMKRHQGNSGRNLNGALGNVKRDGDYGFIFAARAGTGVVRPVERG
jgi:hypothetical protein